MLARLKFEISGLVKEMLDQIDQSVFQSSDSTFLDPAMGGGQFIFETIKRLKEHGHSNANIKSRVHGYESNILYVNYVKERYFREFGEEIPANLKIGGLEELEALKMKFDLVMGNPPYQYVSSGSKRDAAANLYPHFVIKGFDLLKDGGVLSMITPNGWMTPSADIGKGKTGIRIFDLMKKYTTLSICGDCSSYFPDIGSSFTYFVLQKTPNNGVRTIIDNTFEVQLSEIILLPSSLSALNVSIVSKVITESSPIGFTNNNTVEGCNFEKNSVDKKDDTYPVAMYHSSADDGSYRYTKKMLDNIVQKRKVIVSSSGKYRPVYDEGELAFAAKNYVYYLKEFDTLPAIKSYIESNLVRFILNITKTSGWVSSAFRLLPKLDLTRTWTEQELYAYFGLTDEEIEYIESQVK